MHGHPPLTKSISIKMLVILWGGVANDNYQEGKIFLVPHWCIVCRFELKRDCKVSVRRFWTRIRKIKFLSTFLSEM